MVRTRTTRLLAAVALLAAMALLAAACSDDGGEAVTPDEPQDVAEASSTTQAGPDEASDGGDPAEEDIVRPSDTDDDTADDVESGDGTSTSEDSRDAAPVDAGTLLASATTTLDGRSARGEATFDLAPGFSLRTTFESDADGDLAATIEFPPGVSTRSSPPALTASSGTWAEWCTRGPQRQPRPSQNWGSMRPGSWSSLLRATR